MEGVANFRRRKMSSRDDFSKKTVDILARRAGGMCSICKCLTWGPNDNPYTSTNIGKAAHITAASEGGPRYDQNMTPEERKSLKNGIWLCSNCHDKVDRDDERYSTKYLHELKREAENSARKLQGVQPAPNEASVRNQQLAPIISSIAIVEIRKVKAKLPTHPSAEEVFSAIEFIDFAREEYLPEVGSEVLKLLFCLSANKPISEAVYLEIIRHVSDIAETFIAIWGETSVKELCELIKRIMLDNNTLRNKAYRSSLALLKNVRKMAKSKKNEEAMKITGTYYKELIENKMQSLTHVCEETDNGDYEDGDEKGLPPRKRRPGLGQEENRFLSYLNLMLKLGEQEATTPFEEDTDKIEEDGDKIEEDRDKIENGILELGFETDIL